MHHVKGHSYAHTDLTWLPHYDITVLAIDSYAIDDAATDWAGAEAQIAGSGRATVVSVRAANGGKSSKRKSASDPSEETGKETGKKQTRRSKKAKR
jgi:hypothetical protein